MEVNHTTGKVSSSTYFPSPNWNDRPLGTSIDLLVIHGISLPPGEFGGRYVHAFFTNTLNPNEHFYFQEIVDLRVSSHLYIDRGGKIWQFVPFHKRAWHAGQSSFQGRENCNDFSIGIELEGTDQLPYEQSQYDSLVNVTKAIMQAFPAITLDRIVGHSDIAPSRKTDPGESFDWSYYKKSTQILLDK